MSYQSWFLWAAMSAIFAALTAVFAKIGLRGMNSPFAALIHTAVILILLLAVNAFTRAWESPATLSARTFGWLGASGLATGASWLCYFHALRIGDASKVAPVDKSSVVLVALLAFAFLGERPSLLHWTGICLVAIGILLLAYKP